MAEFVFDGADLLDFFVYPVKEGLAGFGALDYEEGGSLGAAVHYAGVHEDVDAVKGVVVNANHYHVVAAGAIAAVAYAAQDLADVFADGFGGVDALAQGVAEDVGDLFHYAVGVALATAGAAAAVAVALLCFRLLAGDVGCLAVYDALFGLTLCHNSFLSRSMRFLYAVHYVS